jgi:hypothetical protein
MAISSVISIRVRSQDSGGRILQSIACADNTITASSQMLEKAILVGTTEISVDADATLDPFANAFEFLFVANESRTASVSCTFNQDVATIAPKKVTIPPLGFLLVPAAPPQAASRYVCKLQSTEASTFVRLIGAA